MPYGGRADGRFYDFLPVGPSDPIPDTNAGQLYTKRVAGVAQLFYQAEDGTVTQITPPTAFTPVDSVFGRIGNVVAVLGDYLGSQVANDSVVAGADVTAALNALVDIIDLLNSSDIENFSGVAGASVTNALNTLETIIGALDSTDIANLSGVAGATVTAALNTLSNAIAGLDSSDIANASSVAGADVTAALNALSGLIDTRGLAGIDARSATFVITTAERNRLQNFTAAGATNLTINTNVLAANDIVYWCTTGAGTMTVNGTATLRARGGLLSSNGQYSYGAIIMLSATEALVVGDRA